MRLQLHELHHNLGYLLHQQGDFLGAIENYRQALTHCPTYALSHYALGVVLAEQQQFPASIAHYQQAIALNPAYGQAYNNLGCVFLLQGNTENAIQIFQQGIERQPDLADLQNNLGQVLFDRDREAAIRAFRRAVALKPDFSLAHRNLGKLLQQYDRHADALQSFQSALAANPTDPEVWSDCVVSWLALGQIEEALTGLHWLIQANQAQVDAYCDWALQLTDTDDLTQSHIATAHFFQAIQHLKAIQSANNAENEVRNHATNQVVTTRSIFSAGAIKFLNQAYFYLGSTLVAYGGKPQLERAEAYLQKAVRLQPQNIQSYLKLADCLMRQKRLNAALLVCDAAESIAAQGELLPIAPNALQIANQRSLIEQQLITEQLINKQVDKQVEKTAFPSNCSTASAAAGLKPEGKTPLGVTSIISVQDWFDRQSRSSDYLVENSGSTATHHLISLADSASLLASQPGSLSSSSLPLTTHSPCEGLNCPICLKQTTDAFQPHYLSRSLSRLTGQQYAVSPTPRFTACIPNGRVWAAPQQNSWLTCTAIAVLSPDHELLTDLSRSYPIELPCSPPVDPHRHYLFSQVSLPPIEKIRGQVAVLAGLSGHNYFHWMVDILPRFEILRQSGIDFSQIDWFYLNSPRAAFQQATLQKLGISLDRILSSDQHPHIQADQMIMPSFTGHFGWLQPWVLKFLRQEFLPLASNRSPVGDRFPERLYISRASANHRRVLNEAAVLEMLQDHGFVSVELEQFSFADQVALFANARTIVAPHGGGLTNLLFCRPGTALLECFSPYYVRHYYWVVSQVLGLTHYCLLSESIKGYPLRELMYASPLTEDLWIDLSVLRTGLEQMGI